MSDTKKDKILVKGSAKKVEFPKTGGHIHTFSVKMSQIEKIHKWLNDERKKRNQPESDYLRLELSSKRETDEWGNTHIVFADLWLPEKRSDAPQVEEEMENPFEESEPVTMGKANDEGVKMNDDLSMKTEADAPTDDLPF